MAVAGAVVVPMNQEMVQLLKERLDATEGVEVRGIGGKGIAVVLEADDIEGLKRLSEQIKGWREVIDLQLAYVNWEDMKG